MLLDPRFGCRATGPQFRADKWLMGFVVQGVATWVDKAFTQNIQIEPLYTLQR